MTPASLVLTLGFGFMLIMGVPIVFALGIASVGAMWIMDIDVVMLAQRMIAGTQSFSLLAVPGFILAGDLMTKGGISSLLVKMANRLMRHITGGLGMVSVLSSMFFACLSGSAPATTATVGSIMIPEMEKRGYPRRFATALASSVGPLGQIIPPSINFIIWGVIAEVSITRLFLSGVVPGIADGMAYMVVCYFVARKLGLPREPRASLRDILHVTWAAKWALFAPVIILGGIYSGIFTPTEASMVAVAYAFFIGVFIHRQVKISELGAVVIQSMRTTTLVMFIVAAASAFGWLLTYERVPAHVMEMILSISDNKIIILLMINLTLLLIGAVMDNLAAMLILAPLLVTVGTQLGLNPVHLGTMVVINFSVGMETPPFGYTLFVASAISGLSIEEISKGILPFFLVDCGMLMLVTFVPFVSMWLPTLVFG
jgi:tripartite ATP-independent transporter DctM subunit